MRSLAGRHRPVLVSRRHPPRAISRTATAIPLSRRSHRRRRATASSSTQHGFFASGVHNHNPVWSPDGQWIYFAHGPEPTEEMDVWRVRPSGGTPEQLTALRAAVNFLAPLDARTLLYVARAEDRSGPWLWSLDVETKVTRRVTSGLEHYTSVSASRDGRRVVATVANPTASLWRVPLLDRPAEDRDVQPYPLPSARALSPALRRDVAVLLVRAAGRATACGGSRTDNRPKSGRPQTIRCPSRRRCRPMAAAWPSSSGKRGNGGWRSCRRTARTREPWPLRSTIQGSGGQGSADWSPDGAWIVAAGADAQGPGCSRSRWTAARPFASSPVRSVNPVWSPDGDSDCVWRPRRGRPGAAPWRETGRHSGRIAGCAGPPGRRPPLPAQRDRSGVLCPARSHWISGCSISPRRRPVRSPTSAITAP